MDKVIQGLVKQVQELKADSGHLTMNNISHTKGLTVVVSVYEGIKPANMILDELYEWAEENNEEVKLLIEKIEKDMSWNKENAI